MVGLFIKILHWAYNARGDRQSNIERWTVLACIISFIASAIVCNYWQYDKLSRIAVVCLFIPFFVFGFRTTPILSRRYHAEDE